MKLLYRFFFWSPIIFSPLCLCFPVCRNPPLYKHWVIFPDVSSAPNFGTDVVSTRNPCVKEAYRFAYYFFYVHANLHMSTEFARPRQNTTAYMHVICQFIDCI